MTPEEEALHAVAEALDDLGVPYMLTGSVAASYHGRPRATHDTDLVIDPTPSQLDELVRRLSERGFYVDGEGAREALRRRRQFNAIETNLACKIDLIIRRDRPFSREEIGRRLRADLGGRSVAIVTPEDSVLSKPEWGPMSSTGLGSWVSATSGIASPARNLTILNHDQLSQVSTPAGGGQSNTALARRSLHARWSEAQPR